MCRELEHNNLTEVNKGWLYGLRMLQQLYVGQNAVERISPDAWEFCQRLSELWVLGGIPVEAVRLAQVGMNHSQGQ